jgi:hypothetical protein
MTTIDIQTLFDRAAISDVINNYACGVDMRDWAMFRSCFTDDVEADFSSLELGSVVHGADDWTANIRATIEALDATQHIITNHAHVIDGDRSQSRANVQAQHILRRTDDGPAMHYMMGGYYNFDMLRTPKGWKIKRYRVTETWFNGDLTIFERGMARSKSR